MDDPCTLADTIPDAAVEAMLDSWLDGNFWRRGPRVGSTEAMLNSMRAALAAALPHLAPRPPVTTEPYQSRVREWILHCFGPAIAADKVERNHRFLEEALELVQSGGCTASEAHQLVDYVFGRPVGEITQEVGGVMNTLAALCNAHAIDLNDAADVELERCWGKSEQIRAKQAAKPKHGPLPIAAPVAAQGPVFTKEMAALLFRVSEILEGHARRDDAAAELDRLRREAFPTPPPPTPESIARCIDILPCTRECQLPRGYSGGPERCPHAGWVR